MFYFLVIKATHGSGTIIHNTLYGTCAHILHNVESSKFSVLFRNIKCSQSFHKGKVQVI